MSTDKPLARLYRATGVDAEKWHDGIGYYWADDEYSGAIGSFATLDAAKAHAEANGYETVLSAKLEQEMAK